MTGWDPISGHRGSIRRIRRYYPSRNSLRALLTTIVDEEDDTDPDPEEEEEGKMLTSCTGGR